MSYIGRDTDKISNVEVLDNITFDGSSSYTLQKSSVNFTPSSANTLLLSIDGVVQAGNFTVSGSTIDFGTAVAGTSTCDFVLHYGVGLITAPSDGTVTEAKIGAGAVTTAKLNDASVSLAKLTATGTKDATTFLRGDNSFAVPSNGLKHLSTTNFSGSSSNVEISLDYSAHENFLLVCDYLEGSSTGSGENCDVHFKRDGQGSFDTGGTDYGFGGILHDTTTVYNVNQGDAMEVFRGQNPSFEHMFVANISGVGNTTSYGSMFVQYNKLDISGGGQTSANLNNVYYKTDRIVAMRFSFTAGTVTKLQAKLYGYGE